MSRAHCSEEEEGGTMKFLSDVCVCVMFVFSSGPGDSGPLFLSSSVSHDQGVRGEVQSGRLQCIDLHKGRSSAHQLNPLPLCTMSQVFVFPCYVYVVQRSNYNVCKILSHPVLTRWLPPWYNEAQVQLYYNVGFFYSTVTLQVDNSRLKCLHVE